MADSRRPEEWILEGQGEPLPDVAEVEGQWIFRNKFYLYRPQDSAPLAAAALTEALPLTDDTPVPGFDAGRLADAMGLTADEQFAHNSAGTLFVAIRPGLPVNGGARATDYRFRVGGTEVVLTLEDGIREGRA